MFELLYIKRKKTNWLHPPKQVDIVDPLNLEKNFDSILEKPIIARNVKLQFLLSSCMYVRSSDTSVRIRHFSTYEQTYVDGPNVQTEQISEMEVEEKDQTNHVEKEVGNVNADSDISFEYGVKPGADFTKERIDSLPFQVQVHYISTFAIVIFLQII